MVREGKMTFILALWLSLFLQQPAPAQVAPYALEDLEALLLQKDPEILASRSDATLQQLLLSRKQAKKWPALTSFYRYTPDDLSLSDRDLLGRQYFSLRLSQDILQYFKTGSGDADALQAVLSVQEQKQTMTENDLLLSIREQYIDVLQDSLRVLYYTKLDDVYTRLLGLGKTRYDYQEDLLIDVLSMEKEALHTRALITYYQNRLRLGKQTIAATLGIAPQEVSWTLPRLQHPVNFTLLTSTAENDNAEINYLHARANSAAYAQPSSAGSLRLSPFIGLQVRANRFGQVKSSPEFGLRASLPLSLFTRKTNLQQMNILHRNLWNLKAEKRQQEMRRQLQFLQQDYQFLQAQIADKHHLLKLIAEKRRLQNERQQAGIKRIRSKPEVALQLLAEKIKAELDERLLSLERDRKVYQAVHAAGLRRFPEKAADAAPATIPAAQVGTQALWVWNPQTVLQNPEAQQAFLALCKELNINKIYLSCNRKAVEILRGDQTFLAQLNKRKITWSALLGEPAWMDSLSRKKITARLDAVLTLNRALADSLQMRALHLDIEPQALADWQSAKTERLQQLAATVVFIHEHLHDRGTKTPVELDIPPYFDRVDETVLAQLLRQVNSVTIMAYRKDLVAHTDMLSGTLRLLNDLHKPFVIGLDASLFASRSELQSAILQLTEKYRANPNFRGFAIHDFNRIHQLTMR